MIFNYSGINISEGAIKCLNKGLSFAILPQKLNLTQVLADISEFERTMEWIEFFHDKDKDNDHKGAKLFKEKKTNRPKDHPTPKGLTTFINSVRSELLDPLNRNKARPNLAPDEYEGLKELIQLQKERKISVKPADKGAGIVILSFAAYMDQCHKH